MLVLVIDPLYHSERIYNPSNFGIIKKTNKIKFVPIYYNNITIKTDLENVELLRPWPLGASEPAPWRSQVYMTLT